MKQDLSDKRKNYNKIAIDFNQLKKNPLEQFNDWYKMAEENLLIEEANAMSLTTIEKDNSPRTRIVLLKSFSSKGFVFYTNYNSQKSKAIINNSNVCLSFFWPALEQQVIINGLASKITEEESDAYFSQRPRASQIGAWVSPQSDVLSLLKDLNEEVLFYEEKFKNQSIPRPKHWGGFIVKPTKYEFWQGRPSRLHDRVSYSLYNNSWKIERLAP